MTDRQLVDAATDLVIQLVNKHRPKNSNQRAEMYYFIGKELLYLAADLSEEPKDESEDISLNQNNHL